MNAAQTRALMASLSDAVTDAIADMRTSPARTIGGKRDLLADPLAVGAPPEEGADLDILIATILEAGRYGINTANGRALAYMPGSGLVASAAADMLAGVINSYTGVSMTAPAMVAIEQGVIRWLTELMGLPAMAGGLLTSGGSMSTLSALLCAKVRHRPSMDLARLYVTEETHHCLAKAARILGFSPDVIRKVPTDERLRMDLRALTTMIAADRAAGLDPFCVVANAGSTSTGTIDPLEGMAEAAREMGLWFHVDAAYGGFFQLTERGRAALRGIEQADSIVLDPHKSLFLPYGTGCLLVRDKAVLRQAHDVEGGAYLRDLDDDGDDFADISPELSRPNRGLRMWLPLRLHGVAAFREALDEKLDLAVYARRRLRRLPHVHIHPGSDLSVIAFRYDEGLGSRASDRLTEELVRQVNASNEIFLATTRLGGQVYARVAILGMRTTRHHVHRACDLVAGGVASFHRWVAA